MKKMTALLLTLALLLGLAACGGGSAPASGSGPAPSEKAEETRAAATEGPGPEAKEEKEAEPEEEPVDAAYVLEHLEKPDMSKYGRLFFSTEINGEEMSLKNSTWYTWKGNLRHMDDYRLETVIDGAESMNVAAEIWSDYDAEENFQAASIDGGERTGWIRTDGREGMTTQAIDEQIEYILLKLPSAVESGTDVTFEDNGSEYEIGAQLSTEQAIDFYQIQSSEGKELDEQDAPDIRVSFIVDGGSMKYREIRVEEDYSAEDHQSILLRIDTYNSGKELSIPNEVRSAARETDEKPTVSDTDALILALSKMGNVSIRGDISQAPVLLRTTLHLVNNIPDFQTMSLNYDNGHSDLYCVMNMDRGYFGAFSVSSLEQDGAWFDPVRAYKEDYEFYVAQSDAKVCYELDEERIGIILLGLDIDDESSTDLELLHWLGDGTVETGSYYLHYTVSDGRSGNNFQSAMDALREMIEETGVRYLLGYLYGWVPDEN